MNISVTLGSVMGAALEEMSYYEPNFSWFLHTDGERSGNGDSGEK